MNNLNDKVKSAGIDLNSLTSLLDEMHEYIEDLESKNEKLNEKISELKSELRNR